MRAAVAAAAFALLSVPALSQEPAPPGPVTEFTVGLSAEDKEAIIAGVVEYFKRNPEELVESILTWRQRGAPASAPDADPSSGNPGGDVTVIEFVDHGCVPCREASDRLAGIAASDGGIRIVHKDFPVGSKESAEASMQVLAASRSGGSWSAAARSLASAGRLDAAAVAAAVKASGAGTASAEALSSARASIEANRQLAARLGIRVLPAMAVLSGGKVQILTGNLTEADITASVKGIRQAAQTR